MLVADDELLIRWSIRETLQQAGHSVTEAETARSVRRELAAGSHPDVVLLDLRLPDSRGLDLLRDVRQMAPESAVVMMTAYGTPEVEAEALALGAYRVINKPFDVASVVPLVRQAFDGRTT